MYLEKTMRFGPHDALPGGYAESRDVTTINHNLRPLFAVNAGTRDIASLGARLGASDLDGKGHLVNRRSFIKAFGVVPSLSLFGALPDAPGFSAHGTRGWPLRVQDFEPLAKTDREWRDLLSPEEFAVLRKEDTERAFTSPLNSEKRPGTFVCAGCFLPLFSSKAKFDSGTGWPSFTAPLIGRMGTKRDFKLIWPRTEYHCARCGGHQGHVFNDGPEPTGERWCNNGVALDFVPEGERFPELRT